MILVSVGIGGALCCRDHEDRERNVNEDRSHVTSRDVQALEHDGRDHVRAATHEEDRTTTGIPHDKMGMWVFLCSEVMFFTGLIGSYIVLRFASRSGRTPATRPEHLADGGEHVHPDLLVGDDGQGARVRSSAATSRKMKLFLCLTLLGGSIFLSIQVYEYRHLLHEGFNPHVSLFGSVFFTTTGFHGFHVFCGVVCMALVHGQGLPRQVHAGAPPGDRDARPLLALRGPRVDHALHDHVPDLT